MFELVSVSVPKIVDYIRYARNFPNLISEKGDVKDVQRPWVVETIRDLLPQGSRVLDLGGSACEVAGFLKSHCSVTVVDPYDGSGNGPTNPNVYRKRHPEIEVIQGYVDRNLKVPIQDCVYSVSVVEHIEPPFHAETVSAISSVLRPGGFSIHSIDLTCAGYKDFLGQNRPLVQSWIKTHGVEIDVQALADDALNDIETFFLSPQMYLQWLRDRPYANYPWRKVASLNVVMRKL